MRCIPWFILAAAVCATAGAAPGEADLPVSIEERIAACLASEDADPARAIALAQSVLDAREIPTASQRAEALGCRGWSHATQARKDQARRDAYALSELVRGTALDSDRVRLTRRAGSILHRSGDRVGAIELYAQALAGAESLGLEAARIPLLVNLGVLHSEFEEHARAQVNYEQALALMARLGDHQYEAPVRYNLGLNLAGEDRHSEAIPHLRRALELIRDTGMGGPSYALSASVALASALQLTGQATEAEALLQHARSIEVAEMEPSIAMEFTLIEAGQRAAAGDLEGALALVDAVDAARLTEIQQGNLLRRRASLLEQLGRHAQANLLLHEVNTLRETYLRHQNHERLAALDAHLRDREQRIELERLQADAQAQSRQLLERERMQWATAGVAGLLLLLGSTVLLWQRRMNRRLYLVSHTDPLTGLANRRAMTQHLRTLSAEANDTTALLLIDIDLFKRVNDEHGHDAGDQVLVAYAQRLRAHAGEVAIVARWGGEEFLVLLPGCDAARAQATADRLRTVLSQPIRGSNGSLRAAASIGYANLPLPGPRTADAWNHSLQLADSALYLAKRAGRDAWAGYWIEHEIADWPAERLGREAHLARSLHLIVPQSSRPLREPLGVAVA